MIEFKRDQGIMATEWGLVDVCGRGLKGAGVDAKGGIQAGVILPEQTLPPQPRMEHIPRIYNHTIDISLFNIIKSLLTFH